jgi:hypothetical protein
MNARSEDHHLKRRIQNGSPTVTQRTHNPPPFDEDNPHNKNNNSKKEKEKEKEKKKNAPLPFPLVGNHKHPSTLPVTLTHPSSSFPSTTNQKRFENSRNQPSQATDNE